MILITSGNLGAENLGPKRLHGEPYGDYKHHVGQKKGILQEFSAGKSSGTSDVLTEYHWL